MHMAPNPQQLRKLQGVLSKINDAIDQGSAAQAIVKLTELNSKLPGQPNVLMLLGKANAKMGRHAEAIEGYAQAVKISPKDADLRFRYAYALQRGGRYEDSLLEYERSLYYRPDHPLALRHKSSVLRDLNRMDEALKAWETLCASVEGVQIDKTSHLGIAISGAGLAPKYRDANSALDDLKNYIYDESCDPELRIAGCWQAGRLYDHLKEYDNAFDAYKLCKEIKKESWSPDEHTKQIDQLIKCWTDGADIPFSNIDGSRLIFIVGMMRSGTSLTEQMVAQTQGVTPGGEMNAISRQFTSIDRRSSPNSRPYPVTRRLYTKPALQRMAKSAMQMYNQIAQTGFVTDKQPYNCFFVPLIAHMFPGCKIIHCVRDPMDCMLSNYTQAFSRPHPQTHDLYDLGRYYRDYERMMAAWKTLPEVDMIDLQYEKMVADPKSESQRVMEFLGIEWTEDILEFHKSSRTVTTASRDQVRQPVYTSSVQKYKRYESHLDELKRGLGIENEA
jgi:tetratricopeptide (TPR) repeat protein